MRVRKVFNQPIESSRGGVNLAGGVQGVVSANVNESGTSSVSSHQSVRIVQRSTRKETEQKEARSD